MNNCVRWPLPRLFVLACFIVTCCSRPDPRLRQGSSAPSIVPPLQPVPYEVSIFGYDPCGYDSVCFGPVGKQIIARQSPEDMARLRATLLRTDGPRHIVVRNPQDLPRRACDYALIIAEEILMDRGTFEADHYSFAPYSCFEYRDQGRARAARLLFGDNAVIEPATYTYENGDGNDITDEYRRYTICIP